MGLEFTNIPDRSGPAVYIIGDGSSMSEARLRQFGEEVDALTPDETQVVYLDPRSGDGLKIKEFYSLQALPCVLIVMDDDTIYHSWEVQIPTADQVSYTLSQVTGSMH